MDENTKARIEKRAYELFMARGGQDGYHMEDWLKAEQEVLGTKDAPAAPAKAEGKPSVRRKKG